MDMINPALTHRTVFEVTRIAISMMNAGEISIAGEQQLYLDVLELGALYDFSHDADDPMYERRLKAYVRAWMMARHSGSGGDDADA